MKKIILRATLLLTVLLGLASCMGDNTPSGEPKVVEFTNGMYILQEGNAYKNVDGTLGYVNYDDNFSFTDKCFSAANSRSLGNTPNSVILDYKNSNIYIAVHGENRVEITNGYVKAYNPVEITEPRCLADDEKYVYVSSYAGTVTKINKETRLIEAVSAKVGEHLEGIAVRDGFVYVCNSCSASYEYFTNVVKLNAETLGKVSDIEVAVNPTSIRCYDDVLYVLSSGNYNDVKSQVQKIDKNDHVAYICNADYFDVYKNNVYAITVDTDWYSYANATYTRHNADGTKVSFAPNGSITSPCGIDIDQINGIIVVGSDGLDADGKIDFAGKGTLHMWKEEQTGFVTKTVGVHPTKVEFIYASYITYQ